MYAICMYAIVHISMYISVYIYIYIYIHIHMIYVYVVICRSACVFIHSCTHLSIYVHAGQRRCDSCSDFTAITSVGSGIFRRLREPAEQGGRASALRAFRSWMQLAVCSRTSLAMTAALKAAESMGTPFRQYVPLSKSGNLQAFKNGQAIACNCKSCPATGLSCVWNKSS